MKSASATVRLADPATVLRALTEHMAEHDITMRVEDGATRAKLPAGEAEIRITSSSMTLQASTPHEDELETVTAFLASHVAQFAHPDRPEIVWSGFRPRQNFADFREMRVVAVSDITSTIRRVRLAGEPLGRFADDGNLHVRLYFPPPGVEPLWPGRGPDGLVQPPLDPARQPSVRKYTIRRIDEAAGWVDVDFVLHRDPGPGSDWARRAVPGDRIGMAGPGGRSARPADWMLLAGDETALPAIARILESLPASTRGVAIVETHDPAGRYPLTGPATMEIRRIGIGQGATLPAVVASIPVPEESSRFCWAGAEFGAVQAIRRHWQQVCRLDKTEQLAVAYWREGVAED